MGDSPHEPLPEDVAEEGGGPIKSFLEHLEDLRWLLVKSGAALLVCLIVCLYATPQIVSILKWPLDHSALVSMGSNHRVLIRVGTNLVFNLSLETNRLAGLDLGTNAVSVIQLEPVTMGSNILLAVTVDPQPSKEVLLQGAPELVYLDPSAPFFSSLRLGFYGGIMLASPFIFYFLAQFILPALKITEKMYVLRAALGGVGLFLTGVAFCFFFMLPRALKCAEWWANWMGVDVPEWRAETYFSFVTKCLIGMGLGFELPVVLLALVKIGILNYRSLAAMRRYMIVINLVLGALLTTQEVLTQVIMAIILQILFEVSVLIAWYWDVRDRKRALQAGESE